MINPLNKLKLLINKRLHLDSVRTKNITKHILLSFIYKGFSIASVFILVPLTLDYLDNDSYGIWLTLTSFISWFTFFDIGMGNGLRNKFAEAKAKGDMSSIRGYISTAYFSLSIISCSLFFLFLFFNFFINLSKIFNTSYSIGNDLKYLMPIVFGGLCLQIVLKLITSIYSADQQHSMQGKVNFFIQLLSLVCVFVLIKFSNSSLLVFGIVISTIPVVVLMFYNIYSFNTEYKNFKPSVKLSEEKYFKSIFGISTLFFVVQLSGIILYTTDNFIISQLFSPAEVVPYNITYKYLSTSIMFFSIISSPYWSGITDAYYRSEMNWIKKSMKHMQKVSFYVMIGIFILVLISKFVYHYWVGDQVVVEVSLILLMAVFFVLNIFVTPFTMFLNGVGKIKIQAFQSIISAIVNIPLSIFLAKYTFLGVNGIIIATIICFLPSVFLAPIQYKKVLNNRSNGIWNE